MEDMNIEYDDEMEEISDYGEEIEGQNEEAI